MKLPRKLNRRAVPVIPDLFEEDISVDLFAGGGGASIGTEAARGRPVTIAINHDEVAIAVHKDNHPSTEHYQADIFEVDPVVACRGRRVEHLHASPDCRHFSRAKGSKPVSDSVRSLADVVPNWLEKVRPKVLTMENVPEFPEWGPLDKHGRPIKARRGEFFRSWLAKIIALGYVVEFRNLIAYHFGAPTTRKRFFLVARCDGQPVCWPDPTHGSPKERKLNPRLKLWHTAAECIDWEIYCPSIFLTKKEAKAQGLNVRRPLARPTLGRVATGVVREVMEKANPFVVQVNHGGRRGAHSINEPLRTITSTQRSHAIVMPTLVQTGHGEREGQAPRVLSLHAPLGTVVATAQNHALVEALLAPIIVKHYGGVVGHGVSRPIGTITAVDHHSLGTVVLAPEEIAAQYPNATKIYPFLCTYYGEGSGKTGRSLNKPLPTITTRDRFGLVLVVVDGKTFAIVDICMRMLEAHELLRAQFGEFAEGYSLALAITKKDKVRLVGNSVAPHMQRAVVGANLPRITPIRSRPTPRATPGMRRAA